MSAYELGSDRTCFRLGYISARCDNDAIGSDRKSSHRIGSRRIRVAVRSRAPIGCDAMFENTDGHSLDST